MGLRDDVLAAKPSHTPCLYQRIRSQLSPDDRADFDLLIADHAMSARAIVAGLAKQSLTLGRSSIDLHRRGGCAACH